MAQIYTNDRLSSFLLDYNIQIVGMFERKRQKNRPTFDQQLERKLNSIKEESHTKQLPVRSQKIINILDEAVYALESHSSDDKNGSDEELQFTQLRVERKNEGRVRESKGIDLERESSIAVKTREREDSQRSQKKVKPFAINQIWNLVTNLEVLTLLQRVFSNYAEEDAIPIGEFIAKTVRFYADIVLKEEQIAEIKHLVKNEITTTNSEVVSLNALEIMAKRTELRYYFIQIVIEARVNLKMSEVEKKNKKLVEAINSKLESIAIKEEKMENRYQELLKRENALQNREKTLTARQRELNLREKEMKKSIQEKCIRIYEEYVGQMSEKMKQAEKRLTQLEKSIKYKIEILERRAEQLKSLKNEQLEQKSKKTSGDNEAKIKLRRYEKEMDAMEKRHQQEMERYELQQKELMKTVSVLEEKMVRNEKKIQKLRERATQLQEEAAKGKQTQLKLEQEVMGLRQKLAERQRNQPLEQQKPMTSKTNRTQKGKKKQKAIDIDPIINLYERILQRSSQRAPAVELNSQISSAAVSSLSVLLTLLCANEESEPNYSSQPHYLVISMCKLVLGEEYALLKRAKQHILEDCDERGKRERFWSHQIAEFVHLPFRRVTKISMLLLLLPLFDWNKLTGSFLSDAFSEVLDEIQEKPYRRQESPISTQLELLSSKECLSFLLREFFPNLTTSLQQDQPPLATSVRNSILISDMLIILSKENPQSFFASLVELSSESVLLISFIDLLQCLLAVHHPKGKGKNCEHERLFKNLQAIEELAEKLSIVLQRIRYNCAHVEFPPAETKQLRRVQDSLSQLNRSNGQRYNLILANLRSILQ